MSKSLWDFAVEIYAGNGVQQACLTLQDVHGADVNMVLAALWEGAVRGRALTQSDVEEIRDSTQEWRTLVVRPLRHMRKTLKTSIAQNPKLEKFRNQIKALELAGERFELEQIELLAISGARTVDPPSARLARRNVELVLVSLYGVAPDSVEVELDTLEAAATSKLFP